MVSDLRDFHSSSRAGSPNPVLCSRAGGAAEPDRPPLSLPGAAGEDGFVGRLRLPVRLEHKATPPTREMLDAAERSNAWVLDFLLHEVDLDALPRPDDERLAAALAPLRVKLDMLTGMVARFAYRDVPLPPICTIALGPRHVVCRARQAGAPGDWLRLDLYFHAVYREPITLFAELQHAGEQGAPEGCEVAARLPEMAAATRESLVRLVFLTQRRQQSRLRRRPVGAFEA